jgi:hypothetical protein
MNVSVEKRAKDVGLSTQDLSTAIENFVNMLSNEELKMFVNDMLNSSCCNTGCGCH